MAAVNRESLEALYKSMGLPESTYQPMIEQFLAQQPGQPEQQQQPSKTIRHDTPHTLAGYDVVLSVSVEAVNNQMQFLYNKELPDDRLPPPQELEGQEPLPPAQHFINHHFQIFPKDPEEEEDDDEDEGVTSGESDNSDREGIDGHILAPRVAMHPNKPGVVILTLRFHRDETVIDESKRDSVLQLWRRGKRKPQIKRTVINGWTLSWESSVAQKDIDDVVEDLINPSRSNSHIQLPDTAAEQILGKIHHANDQIDSSVFTASSIFCVLEAVEMTNSFSIKNENGQNIAGNDEAVVCNMIINHFKRLREAQKTPHLPTADDPFVLGYGITQKTPDLKSINPNIEVAWTPEYMVPRKVDLTTTSTPGSEFCEGTFNFCMLTHRYNDGKYGGDSLAGDDGQLGQFDKTFFGKLTSYGGSNSTDRPGGHDAIMAFSEEVFRNLWVSWMITRPMLTQPENLAQYLVPPEAAGALVAVESENYSHNADACWWKKDYKYSDFDLPAEYVGGQPVYLNRRGAQGFSEVWANISSDYDNYSSEQRRQSDLARNLYLTCGIRNNLSMKSYTKGLNALGTARGIGNFLLGAITGDTDKALEWQEARSANMYSEHEIKYELSPGQGGVWSMRVKESTIPEGGDEPEIVKAEGDSPPWSWAVDNEQHKKGSRILTMTHNTFQWAGQDGETEKFKETVRQWNQERSRSLQETINNLLSTMRSTVIMPAGNVLAFKGLDCDPEAGRHIYTHADYMTNNELSRVGKDESVESQSHGNGDASENANSESDGDDDDDD